MSREGEPDAFRGSAFYRRLKEILRREEGFDLDAYRAAYLRRRVNARLAVVRQEPDAYVAVLEREAGERRALMETLGVNVTSFFRDAGVWRFLEDVALPPLVEERALAGRTLRAVSLGCSSGQEPYSLAMLLSEIALEQGEDEANFTVDAFDADPAAVATARAAEYPPEAIRSLSPEAIARYFEPVGEGEGALFRVADALRRRVRVRRKDILTEPFGSTYDVALCRNVMIYLDADAKETLLRKIHGSLAPSGILALGQSEGLLGPGEALFRPLSLRQRVYARAV